MDDSIQKIIDFYKKASRMPSYAEVAELFGYKSKNAASKLVDRLIDAGALKKDKQGKISFVQSIDELPFCGLVEAGIPSITDGDILDTLSVEEYLIPKRESTFILEVKGDSMIEAHIDEGDLVVATRAETAKDGQIVIAEVDGGWTMKYFKTDGKKAWLLPANRNYKPIYPEYELRVAAIVTGVIRRY